MRFQLLHTKNDYVSFFVAADVPDLIDDNPVEEQDNADQESGSDDDDDEIGSRESRKRKSEYKSEAREGLVKFISPICFCTVYILEIKA